MPPKKNAPSAADFDTSAMDPIEFEKLRKSMEATLAARAVEDRGDRASDDGEEEMEVDDEEGVGSKKRRRTQPPRVTTTYAGRGSWGGGASSVSSYAYVGKPPTSLSGMEAKGKVVKREYHTKDSEL